MDVLLSRIWGVICYAGVFPLQVFGRKKNSDTGNRTPSCRVKGGNVSRYTISDI